jgi:hypothetical protein
MVLSCESTAGQRHAGAHQRPGSPVVGGGRCITEGRSALIGQDCGGKARTLGDGTHLFRTQLVDKGVDKCLREYKQGKVSGVDNA